MYYLIQIDKKNHHGGLGGLILAMDSEVISREGDRVYFPILGGISHGVIICELTAEQAAAMEQLNEKKNV